MESSFETKPTSYLYKELRTNFKVDINNIYRLWTKELKHPIMEHLIVPGLKKCQISLIGFKIKTNSWNDSILNTPGIPLNRY